MSGPKKTQSRQGGATSATKKTGAGGSTNGRSRATGKGAAKSVKALATTGQLFQPVPAPTRVDYPLLERDVQQWWDEHDILKKYVTRNEHADKRWSFVDGPITANNPMGVHHAWGRTYKDL